MLETKEKYENKAEAPEIRESVTNVPSSNVIGEDEIDLMELAKAIWAKRRIIWLLTFVAFLIGVFVAIFSPEEYSSSIVLMPQSDSAGGNAASGLLRQVGGIAGISLGSDKGSGTLGPALYPEVTQSTPFYLFMMEKEMYFSTLDTTTNFATYFSTMQQKSALDYAKTYTIGLPKLILSLPINVINSFKSGPKSAAPVNQQDTAGLQPTPDTEAITPANDEQEPVILTGKQLSVISKMKGRIQTEIEKNGTVKVSVEMPDPMAAARTTEIAVKYLTNYIQEYRTEKAQQDLAFIEKQYEEKREKYNTAQQRLARFQDQNNNIFTESARIELERLRTENNLAFSLYQGLAQQLEQAKIKVQEDKPVFKVLEPIQIPLSPSKPQRELIITMSIFAGLFLGATFVFLQVLYVSIKNKIL